MYIKLHRIGVGSDQLRFAGGSGSHKMARGEVPICMVLVAHT